VKSLEFELDRFLIVRNGTRTRSPMGRGTFERDSVSSWVGGLLLVLRVKDGRRLAKTLNYKYIPRAEPAFHLAKHDCRRSRQRC
jgi:hypothetical protein